MKMAAGSENESDDAPESTGAQVTRTPALQVNEETFTTSAGSEPKKSKLSPSKAKTSNAPASGSNSKNNSPSKSKRSTTNTTPSKTKTNKK